MQRPKRIAFCLLIVLLNGGPGIVFAWARFDRTAILLGVAVWMLFYLWLGHTDAADQLLKRGYVRYGIGTAVLLRFIPFCWILDLFCGAFCLTVAGLFPPGDLSPQVTPEELFIATFAATVLHGFFIGILFWGAVAAITYLYSLGWKGDIPSDFCEKCGYDLRASPVRCPECGTPNPHPERATLTTGAAAASDEPGIG